ncbi:MAG: ABC-ATPase domain-containing protein [Lachnospiraceae bacterium]|nr:ABC-ATPase domain-containing protein [Lachnospiraceae bacterium]
MKTAFELENELKRINRKPYPVYKSLKGSYRFSDYVLTIDHVQGDPFAAPSRLHIKLSGKEAGFPKEYWDTKGKRIALADFCLRLFGNQAERYAFKAKGSGKSGLISVSQCGQQVLSRSSCQIGKNGDVLLRFEVGFPANGRTINSMELMKILMEYVPACVKNSLMFSYIDAKKAKEVLDLYEDQESLLKQCQEKDIIAFIADGSILPRKSGVSQKPMKEAKPFFSPESMKAEFVLPHKGKISGMAVFKGITLIVGGGYHGKSTLLKAIETGIYHHIAGDGREYVVTDPTAFKIRAEDGRSISQTDISMFINHLPNQKDTKHFSTEDASGSTSQAANVAEAVETGAKVLLIDEDTSATNFMVRDELMAKVIAKEKEPITPFISRARQLYLEHGVSTILVAGSSGAYFSIADTVLQMDCYQAFDITEKVKAICESEENSGVAVGRENMDSYEEGDYGKKYAKGKIERRLVVRKLEERKGQVKVKQYGNDSFSVGKETVELRGLEQLLDYEQTTTLGYLLRTLLLKMEKEKSRKTINEYMEEVWGTYRKEGMEGVLETDNLPAGFAEVRFGDFGGVVNRYRGFLRGHQL